MASSADSPENARQRRMWALWQELLPGIEDFLVRVLAHEKLSQAAEWQRQYFVERLDILKLPPSLPPRAGKRISVELLQETEKTSGIPAELVPGATLIESEIEKDFAAKQREISRNLTSVSTDKEDDDDDSDSSKGVKVYDDIDPTESSKNDAGDDEDDDDDINALYEIPIARQNPPPTSEDSLSQPADISSLATGGSVDDVSDDVLETSSPGSQRPPLPPRHKRSESESRNSVNSLDGKPPELPFRPPLAKKNEIYARSDKSEKSEKSDLSDGDSTSYESFDEEDKYTELRSKPHIKLPKRQKKKNKTTSKLLSSKTRSSSTWEINVPFKKLENVQLSGDLHHRGKITWSKRLVAISNGSMALYKPEKDARPVFVIPLTGYQAVVGDRDGKKGFEIRLTHTVAETHVFTADFREWASIWCDHINAVAQGLPIPSYPQHLARTMIGGNENSAYGSKIDFSLGEYDEGDYEMYEEYTADSNNSVFDTPPPTPQSQHSDLTSLRSTSSTGRLTSRLNHFTDVIGLRSPSSASRLSSRTLPHSDTSGLRSPSSSSRLSSRMTLNSDFSGSKSPSSSRVSSRTTSPSETTPGMRSPASTGSLTPKLGRATMPHNRSFAGLTSDSRATSTLTLSRWDWKTLFYNWSFPLDQIILGLRRGNLSNSNSNLSVSSEGVESDDSSKPVRLRSNKVMRMGSFAFRATQFFENLGKKSTSKRKSSGMRADSQNDLSFSREGIQEESSISSGSIGVLAVTPTSDLSSPIFADDSLALSLPTSPTSSDALPSPIDFVNNVKHQGYLNIFSSFNKRRWGQRWCLVRENMFECYRTKTSHPCELNFLLRNCVLRQALAETNSPLAMMLLENNKEKITVEPTSKDDMSQWLRVLMMETATEAVPEGLEEFFVDAADTTSEDQTVEAEYTDIMGALVIKSWEVGKATVLPCTSTAGESQDHSSAADNATGDQASEGDVGDKYLYTAVVKRPSSSTLEEVSEERDEEEEERDAEEVEGGEVSEEKDSGKKRRKDDVPRFTDNLAVYNSNKNTTDSGFYSVKEANSDSESGSELTSEEASPRTGNASPPLPLPSSSPPPLPASSSPPAEKETSRQPCASEKGTSDSVTSYNMRQVSEEDEDESVLERTMTADDFKEHMENGGSDVTPGPSAACDGLVNAEKDKSDGNSSAVRPEHSERLATETAETSEETQQQKSKKKKRKSKSKKNKQNSPQEESRSSASNGPLPEQNGDSSVTPDKISTPSDSVETRKTENPDAKNTNVNTNPQPASVLPQTSYKNSEPATNPAERETTSTSGETNSASSDRSANVLGGKLESPDENETISDLRERIIRLREKLIQIKRKRIAVRDKRVRAFSVEERAVCDKEYLVLDTECRETSATIQRLEEELKMAVEAAGQS